MYSVPIIKHSKGTIKRGSFYAVALQLESHGYITSERVDTGNPIIERLYKITETGKIVLDAYNKVKAINAKKVRR